MVGRLCTQQVQKGGVAGLLLTLGDVIGNFRGLFGLDVGGECFCVGSGHL